MGMPFTSPFGHVGEIVTMKAWKAAAGTAAFTDIDTGSTAAVLVTAGFRWVILGGFMSCIGNASQITLEDEDGNDLSPPWECPPIDGGTIPIIVTPFKVPTANKGIQINIGGAGSPEGQAQVYGYLEAV